MANQKWQAENYITIGGVTTAVPTGAVTVVLFDPTTNASAAESMRRAPGDAVYVVTSGAKFVLLGIWLRISSVAGAVFTIHEGATEDAQTTQKASISLAKVLDFTYEISMSDTTPREFAAGKYVVIKPSAGVVEYTQMIGYEIKA